QICATCSKTQTSFALAQGSLCFFQRCNVNTRTDVAKECAIPVPGDSSPINPVISAIMTPEPILHSEVLARLKPIDVDCEAAFVVIGMNALRPAISHLLRHAAAGKR